MSLDFPLIDPLDSRPDVGPQREMKYRTHLKPRSGTKNKHAVSGKHKVDPYPEGMYYLIVIFIVSIIILMYIRLEVALLTVVIVVSGCLLALESTGKRRQWLNLLVLVTIFISFISFFVTDEFISYTSFLFIIIFILMIYVANTNDIK